MHTVKIWPSLHAGTTPAVRSKDLMPGSPTGGERNPRTESTIEYLATLNTDYNAALDELDMVRYENRKLRAWVAHGVEPAEEEPVEDPADAPRRKKARYNDPEARTYIRHHED
ncbi:hypothetical protein U9M48_032772 [Paspalum notatum var. saurae]|uniref:Uncharacterized protein n=1 Tax=Paspalum notatum var. saurae TaxID=547442 RepID=A0AAQ3U7Z1_PASNO